MLLWEIPKHEWMQHLVPLLTGKARAAYGEVDALATFPVVKQAILSQLGSSKTSVHSSKALSIQQFPAFVYLSLHASLQHCI